MYDFSRQKMVIMIMLRFVQFCFYKTKGALTADLNRQFSLKIACLMTMLVIRSLKQIVLLAMYKKNDIFRYKKIQENCFVKKRILKMNKTQCSLCTSGDFQSRLLKKEPNNICIEIRDWYRV